MRRRRRLEAVLSAWVRERRHFATAIALSAIAHMAALRCARSLNVWRAAEARGRATRRRHAHVLASVRRGIRRRVLEAWAGLAARTARLRACAELLRRRSRCVRGQRLLAFWTQRLAARRVMRSAFGIALSFHRHALELGEPGLMERLARRVLCAWRRHVVQVGADAAA